MAEVDQILVDDAAHAMQRAVDVMDAGKPARLQRHADQRLVDDGGRASPLRHQNLARHSALPPLCEARRFPVPSGLAKGRPSAPDLGRPLSSRKRPAPLRQINVIGARVREAGAMTHLLTVTMNP